MLPVTYPNIVKEYSAKSTHSIRPSTVSGQYPDPMVVTIIDVHHNAVPKSFTSLC